MTPTIGSIVFVRGHSPLSKLISSIDGGEFSHCCMFVSNGTHIVESQRFVNTRITPFVYTDYEIVDLKLTKEEQQKIVQYSISSVGKKYDYMQIVSIAAKELLHININLNNPYLYICSELICVLLYMIGRMSREDFLKGFTPNELYNFLKK